MNYAKFNLDEYQLDEMDVGIFKLPSEIGEIKGVTPWRAFSLILNRWYSLDCLSSIEGMKINLRDDENEGDLSKFIAMKLSFSQSHWNNLDDTTLKSLVRNVALDVCSQSKVRYCSGNRATFVYEYPNSNEILVIMSTSVFFNDFRVTTNAPSFNSCINCDDLCDSLCNYQSNDDTMIENMKEDIIHRLNQNLIDINYQIDSFNIH